MNRMVLGIAGALVAVAAIALVILLSRGGDAKSSVAPAPPAQGSAVVVNTAPTGGGTTPALATDPPAGSDTNPRDYTVGGVKVRDHRTGDVAPLDIPPGAHPANSRELPSTLTAAISGKVQDLLQDCGKAVPREARGQKPRMEGQITVAIKDHQLSITGATIQLRDVTGESVEPTKQCIQSRSLGLSTPAPDQDDVENYSISLKFVLL